MSLAIDKALRKAQSLIRAGELTEAEELYKQVLSKFSKNKKAIQGYQKLKAGMTSKGSLTSEPPQEQVKNLLSLYNQGQFEEVLAKVKPLISLFPNAIELYNLQGASNAFIERNGAAIESYDQAIKINPKYVDAHLNKGSALQKKGELGAAMESFNKALSIDPYHSIAHFNMGNVLNEKGELNAVVESYKRAIKIKPDYAEAYFNMGIALENKGELDAAMESYKQAIKIKPNYAEAYNNMGNALFEKGELDGAIDSLNHAIKINSDYAEAYLNMGNVLFERGELDAAIESYKRAIKIKPDYAEAYGNMGNVLFEKGELEAVIESLKKAINIKSDYAEAYINMAFPLQSIKLRTFPVEDYLSLLAEQTASNYAQIRISILKYTLDLGSVHATNSLNNAISLLSTANNICIDNPNFKKNECLPKPALTEKITALVHFGRSGTGLLHSLIDGHSEISTLPSIYLSEFFDHSIWEKIITGGWQEMASRFISNYEVLFDASSSNPIASKSIKLIENAGRKEGMANLGEQRDEILSVDKQVFSEELNRLMVYYDRLDAFTFFKLVHSAFNKTLNDHNTKNLIFYHIHNPDTYAQLNFLKSAPHTSWLTMVREPVQACEAWVQKAFKKNDYRAVANRIFQMLFEIDNVILRQENSIGLRLEDLKEHPEETIPALCAWLGIKEEDSLYKMTAQGKKWWGDPASPDYEKDGMNPFGKTSIRRKIGLVFSNNDQFVLRTLFYPFSVRFGYAEENTEQFKNNRQAIRPMLDQMFDFEKKIVMETKADAKQFMKSGSYLYLRSGMIERWNTLNEFHTYPNMLRPLKIN